MLTPHVVRAAEINPLNLQEIDTGTGTNVELRRISTPANGHASGTDGPPPGLQPHTPVPPPVAAAPAAGDTRITNTRGCNTRTSRQDRPQAQ